MKMLNRWAAVLILMTAVLLPTMSIGAATGEDGHREIVRLREIVRGLVSELALAKSLDTDDVANLRDDLAQVYRDLDALADHLGYAGQDSPQPDNGWRPYTAADIRSRPSDAEFNGWNKNADVDLNWGEYGEIIVVVANIDYQAECLIHRAYTGNVQASLRTETTGSVIIKVQDELGTHEFRIDNGGLGPVHVRGRDDLLPAAPAQPAAPAVSVAAGTTTWYSGYYELVETGQLGESPDRKSVV